MRRNARVVGPTDAFDALWVTSKPDQNRSIRGGTNYLSYADPTRGLKIESLIPFAVRPFPKANSATGCSASPRPYSQFGGYVPEATTLGELQDNGLDR